MYVSAVCGIRFFFFRPILLSPGTYAGAHLLWPRRTLLCLALPTRAVEDLHRRLRQRLFLEDQRRLCRSPRPK